ncbi:MAG: M23 family metallopeptidase [Aminipila sp.]
MIVFNHLPVTPLRVTGKFGPRKTGIKGASTDHHGVDLGRDFSKADTVITAVAKGTVKYNGWHKYRGWYVVIQHDGFQTLYQHLKYKCTLPIGTIVPSGAAIDLMGNSSDTSVLKVPIHLHFAVCKDFSKPTENGRGYVDPLPYLKNISNKKVEEEEEEMKRYNKVEELPKGLQKETQELINSGALKGDANGNLDVTEDMVRCMIINKRYIDSKK